MDTPRLSVVMGVYNISRLFMFEKAMQSVLSQTMSDFEFVICDDGSTDNTWERLKQLAARDCRVRLIRSLRNEGLATALNRCIQATHAPLIARQDADDLSEMDRFQHQVDFLDFHPEADFVGAQVLLYDENGPWGRREFPEWPQKKDFLFGMPFVHGALMFRRVCLETVGGYRVSKETRRAEDYDMLMRMYATGIRGANIPNPLYWFLEDKAAQHRRKYRYRFDEVKVRYEGFCRLGLMPGAMPYVIKPLIVGLIPGGLLRYLKSVFGRQKNGLPR